MAWDEAVKIPFLIRYPGIGGNEGAEVSSPLNTPDILPSMLSLVNIDIPGSIEGEDLSSLIRNPEKQKDRAVLFMSVSPFATTQYTEYRGIKTSRYTYVKTPDEPVMLFDHSADPYQLNNLVGLTEYEGLQNKMNKLLAKKLKEIANEIELRVANKPDSQDICFISRAGGKEAFLGDRIKLKPATIVDSSGEHVGTAPAVQLVTIGQRKGIGLAGNDSRRYVTNINHKDGIITVGPQEDLLVDMVPLETLEWSHEPVEGAVMVQFSAHGAVLPATVVDGEIRWDTPQRKVATGQSVVLYVGDEVVGGGIAGA